VGRWRRSPTRTGTPVCGTAAAVTAGSGSRTCGLWRNFGDTSALKTQRAVPRRAFGLGVTHIDLANTCGTRFGSAEADFGLQFRADCRWGAALGALDSPGFSDAELTEIDRLLTKCG
jgi:hypothetical protein